MTFAPRLPRFAVGLVLATSLLSCGGNQSALQPRANATAGSATASTQPVQLQAPAASTVTFDRGDFLAAMNRLHQHYMAPEGLKRPNGLSINGAPDFLGIAAWIFDIYLACRSAGQGTEDAWNEVVVWISQSDEWRVKHPGEAPRTPRGCTTTIRLDRNEFLQAMQRLDNGTTTSSATQCSSSPWTATRTSPTEFRRRHRRGSGCKADWRRQPSLSGLSFCTTRHSLPGQMAPTRRCNGPITPGGIRCGGRARSHL